MATYTVLLKYLDGTIVELFPKSYSFTDELNKESTAKLSLSFDELRLVAEKYQTTVAAFFTPAIRIIEIIRNGTKVFNGVITQYALSPDQQGAKNLNIDCVSWFGLLGRRYFGFPSTIYTAQDAGDIAWDIINTSQTSDSDGAGGYYSNLGITRGLHPATKTRDRTYQFDNVKDAIIKLSNSNLKDGFDFELDANKVFNIYYPTKGNTLDSLVFDDKNLANWSYKLPLALTLANRVIARGEGSNDDVLYVVRTGLAANRSAWYTQEALITERDVKVADTLNDKGDAYLAANQTPPETFGIEHYDDLIKWEDYAIGDLIRVNLPDIGLSNVQYRVTKREFSMDSAKSIAYIKTTVL